MCADAVKDAKLNAVANKITNCQFEVGRAEDTIPKVCAAHLLSSEKVDTKMGGAAGADGGVAGPGGEDAPATRETFGSCVAVLDPPREGVHWKVIRYVLGTERWNVNA